MNQKKVGLALSGGFIRASAQIGVIEVLEENGISIDIVSGCSSGAVIAGAYASGHLSQIKKRLLEGKRRDYWYVIFEPTIPKKGLLKGQRARKFFEEFVGEKNFSDLGKPLILTATDLKSMQEVIITEGKVAKAIQACTAVTGIFVPVDWQGKILVDGGNFNLIPSKALYSYGADYVIAVDVSQPPNPITRFFSNFKKLINRQKTICQTENICVQELNIFQLIRRAASLSTSQIKNFYHHAYPYNILIKPQLEHVKRWQVGLVKDCIEEGRKVALAVVPQIKKDLGL